jgi:hypothetical protein
VGVAGELLHYQGFLLMIDGHSVAIELFFLEW